MNSSDTSSSGASVWRRREVFERRLADWRIGAVVYQVFVDRFAPSRRLREKADLYAPPRILKPWNAAPERGRFLADHCALEGELEFYGGDLDSLRDELNYIQCLGAEALYLNPVFLAFTNHKYDTMDYFQVDPQYGGNEALRRLAGELRERGMRLLLDGVFNHLGRRAAVFQRAAADAASPERALFTFGEDLPNGYLGWRNHANLPEWRLETPEARERLYAAPGSVAQFWLREFEIDGWRLDVAPDLGPQILAEITETVRRARPGAVTIGECWNYPEEWLRVLDGILNLHAGNLILNFARGRLAPAVAARALERMIADAGIEGILRSHLVLDNHDTARLATLLPDPAERRLARFLQLALPGCPVIYYGSELGMTGGAGFTNRGPMRWDLATERNEELIETRRLLTLRRENPALRVGGFRALESGRLLAFLRLTHDPRETLVALVNPGEAEVEEIVPLRDSLLMDAAPLECLLTGERAVTHCGWIEAKLPPKSARLYRTADRGGAPGYSMFKRV